MAEVQVGDLADADLLDMMLNPPVGRVLATATQSMTHNTNTAVAFAGEDFDTHTFHDIATNNSRVTPSTGWAGYYEFHGVVHHGSRADYTTCDAFFRKNGVTTIPPGNRKGIPLITSFQSVHTFCTVSLDPGSGDYIELIGFQVNGASAAQVTAFSGVLVCVMEWKFLRPL